MHKVAWLGGAFNPLTLSHLHIVEKLVGEGYHVVICPRGDGKKPIKQGLAPADLRIHWIEETLRELSINPEKIRVSRAEVDSKEATTYTFNMLPHYKAEAESWLGTHEFHLLIGGDNWDMLPRWYRGPELEKSCTFIVWKREELKRDINPPHKKIETNGFNGISSTLCRELIAKKAEVSHLMHPKTIKLCKEYFSTFEAP